jgi:Leucine-rich repeat (LRR) protein
VEKVSREMLLSQRLIIRNQAIGVQIPDEPDSVTDAIVLKLCALSGRHQRIISVARCYRLTNNCLENIGRCLGLQYLNLSYTKVENISPLMNLPMLRSLSLAGLVLINYEDLRWLVTVEILNLQYSNFSKPELLSDFNLLRSLDLGNTMISSISDLRRLDRLEELCLDSTKRFKDETISESIQTLQCFPDLKYLQIGNSPLVKSFHTLQQSISPLTSIITKPRRISWFENVINNNHEEVRQMILNGQDVNLRSGPEDIDLFTFYYFHKCQMKTQYFDCCSLVEIYRPCATHVAIFFNCKETLELLIAAQVGTRLLVLLFSISLTPLAVLSLVGSAREDVRCGMER